MKFYEFLKSRLRLNRYELKKYTILFFNGFLLRGIYKIFTFKVQKDEIVIIDSKIKGLQDFVFKIPGTYFKIPILHVRNIYK